jgi:hypothetical protein
LIRHAFLTVMMKRPAESEPSCQICGGGTDLPPDPAHYIKIEPWFRTARVPGECDRLARHWNDGCIRLDIQISAGAVGSVSIAFARQR